MKLIALVALLGAAACTGPAGISATGAQESANQLVVGSHALKFVYFTAGQTAGFPSTAFAVDLALGPDGNMWFTDAGTPAIGRIATDGTVTEFTSGLPSGATPDSIVAGPDGNMWFSDSHGLAIGKVTPQGAITEFDARKYRNSFAMGIAFGAGAEPYFIGTGSPQLLAHLTASGEIVAKRISGSLTPAGALAADASGNLWFVVIGAHKEGELYEQQAYASGFSRQRIKMQQIELPCCPNQAPKSIAVGADGNPWFTTLGFGRRNSAAQYLGTLSSGQVRLIRIRTNGLSNVVFASGIASATNGLWITAGDPFLDSGALFHINADGRQTSYELPYDPLGVAVDAAGNPWYTTRFLREPSRIVEVLR